ncbi:hypothetical protein PHAVU_003G263600 [Phaseolus vulgaris]|uniref:Calmodulin-lysine N-methyltransferase n=1 Tax=Phaseolus vulgaris TaxID=3885 RepID=V7CGZ1_PHAVU|nr:hypothetical protein PHAVU_003G263600g [Phaseolus vulgaris]ESW28156.1 hypothetical protein PHAVU_003G263600g [Phaseolus vulgaris]
MDNTTNDKASSLRWKILRRALLSRSSPSDSEKQSQIIIKRISRRTSHGFNLIPSQVIDDERDSNKRDGSSTRDARVCYTLPIPDAPQLFLTQRVDSRAHLGDFEICNRYNIDNTGLVCNWPSEDVLAHYCLSHADTFRSKKVIELGSGYGLAGFVIAAATGASEVVISDGNPQVVDYTQRNIEANSGAFGNTVVKSMTLHWNQEDTTNLADTFDIIIASDCTFFKDFHRDLARIVKHLLSKAGSSEAIFLSPKRGNSLDLFLEVAKENGLRFSVTENYDQEVWKRHEAFLSEDRDSWPSYEKGHSYPLLIRITL